MTYYITLGLILFLSLFLKIVPGLSKVFVNGQVLFREVDPWYHMRLADYTFSNFPHVMHYDAYAAYPSGSTIGFYPVLSWTVAALAKLLHTSVDLVGAFLPPIAGSLIIIVVFLICKELWSKTVGLIAALIVTIIPGELFHRSLLGFADQHVLEVLFMTLTILFLVLWMKKSKILFLIPSAVGLSLYVLNWHGSAILPSILAVWALVEHSKKSAVASITLGTIGFVFSFLILRGAPDGLVNLTALVVLILAGVGAYYLNSIKTKRTRYIILGLGATSSVLVAAALSFLILHISLWKVVGPIIWGIGTPIQEVQPLDFHSLLNIYGVTFLGFLIGLFLIIKSKTSSLITVWFLALFLIGIAQVRWGYYFTIPLAICFGVAAMRGLSYFKENARAPILTVILLFTILTTVKGTYGLATLPNTITSDWVDSLNWLRNNTSELSTDYYKNGPQIEDYGVLSWWDYGHWIIRMSHRIPVASPSYQVKDYDSSFFVASDEKGAEAAIKDLDIKYVIVDLEVFTTKWESVVYKGRNTKLDKENSFAYKMWNEQLTNFRVVYRAGNVKIYEHLK